jgi:hypothetical protein
VLYWIGIGVQKLSCWSIK